MTIWCSRAGAVDNYFGHSEWARYAPGMKEVEDATLIRSRLLMSFEAAELEDDPAERAADLSFVIVGGGPTGVELAGAIKELAVDVIPRDFRVADTRRARVILIEAGPRLLPALEPAVLGARTQAASGAGRRGMAGQAGHGHLRRRSGSGWRTAGQSQRHLGRAACGLRRWWRRSGRSLGRAGASRCSRTAPSPVIRTSS